VDPVLAGKLASLPAEPGVYVMKDRSGRVLYVGKAVNLRDRVRSYFAGGDPRPFVPLLERLLGDIETVVVRNEKEALLLENELIRRHKPRFNLRPQGGRNFVYLRLDTGQRYPRLEVTRRVSPDGARYFGPYPLARALRDTLRVVNRYFKLRTCSDHDPSTHERPCLLCQIAHFPAPSVYDIPPDEYRRQVEDAVLFLEGKHTELIDALRTRMNEAAAQQRFEEAARLRDQIAAVERTLEPQRIVAPEPADRAEEIQTVLERLRARLGLMNLPRRMECFDVSHFHGGTLVASKVAMADGRPDKDRYRRYRITSVRAGDDFAAMYEVVSRRLRRGIEENDLPDLLVIDGGKGQLASALAAIKDLGAKGMDVIALAKARGTGGGGAPHGPREGLPERIFLPKRREPVVLPQDSPEMLLLARLRDEAHRFAITYQRKLLRRERVRSALEDIPGIGPARRRALLRHFGSLKRVREASVEELAEVEGIGDEMARRIREHLHREAENVSPL
jgi:excinuclease ABC subunit C